MKTNSLWNCNTPPKNEQHRVWLCGRPEHHRKFYVRVQKKGQEIFQKTTITKNLSRVKEKILGLREVQDSFEVHTRKIVSGKQRIGQWNCHCLESSKWGCFCQEICLQIGFSSFLCKKNPQTHMALFTAIIKTAQICNVEKLEISHLPSGHGPSLMLCIFPALGILPLVLKYLVFFWRPGVMYSHARLSFHSKQNHF